MSRPHFCRVRGCRYPHTHLTCAHKCGKCDGPGSFGHGMLECDNEYLRHQISLLLHAPPHQLPSAQLYCDVEDCPAPWTHMRSAHHCRDCGARGCDGVACLPGTIRATDTSGAASPSPSTVTCPLCKVHGPVGNPIFVAADCVVCFESRPLMLFPACSHACVCQSCAARLSSDPASSP